jgi:KDO2-lipid IV(A) lauroyltransferase
LLVYLLVRTLLCVIQALPMSACQAFCRGLATLACKLKVRRKIVEENLRHAFPELSENERNDIAWRMWEHLFLMLIEMAHAPRKIHDSNWRDYLQFVNDGEMIARLWSGKPNVFLSAHHGNFELAGYVLGMFGFPTFTVARPLDNPFLDRYINAFRSSQGQYILPKNGSAADVDRMLAGGATLSVLGDQHAGPKGCFVEFFGRPASTHKSIALFSIANHAPLLVGYAERQHEPLHYMIGTEQPISPADFGGVREMTQHYSRILETIIRRAPEQYWWLHRRWRDAPPARRQEKLAA